MTDVQRITHGILSVCLVRRGEDPIHPSYGMAPELFEPLSNYAPEYWVWNAKKTLQRWVPGIQSLSVDVRNFDALNTGNQLQTEIRFIPKRSGDTNTLTWGYYAYQGAIWNREFSNFLADIHLNGQPVTQLR